MAQQRIAAVSSDGIHVDGHFGKAERFSIYDVGDQISWVEDRPTETLSVGDPGHPFDAEKFGRIASLLKDCTKVYVTQIGEKPAAELKALGIQPVVFKGGLAEIDPNAV
ncbi:MAG: NifB/NifX family molybdenum-iron cluster-binding protein [Desulfobacteraceae bacterium]